MRVRLTGEARADLVAWIGRRDPAAAVDYGDRLVARAVQIGEMPLAFPIVAHPTHAGLRKRSHGNHVIIYRVRTEVEILRILDARRDYLPLLDDL